MTIEAKHELRTLFAERRSLLSIIVVACGLGFAISTLSAIFVVSSGLSNIELTATSAIIAVAALSALYKQVSDHLRFEETIDAVLMLDQDANPIRVEQYDFMEAFVRVIDAVKAENKAIYSDWQTEPLVHKNNNEDQDSRTEKETERAEAAEGNGFKLSKGEKLAEEVAFFTVIDFLSTHLTDYFNSNDLLPATKTLERTELPQFLLSNRVINLLSAPVDQRDIFMERGKSDHPSIGKVVAVFGPDGAMFSDFALTTPEGSKVSALGHNGISMKSKRVELNLSVCVTPFAENVSTSFAHSYLGKNWSDVHPRLIQVKIAGRVRPLSVFLPRGWASYGWLDSLRSRIRESFGFESFLSSINWNMIEPLLYSMEVTGKIFRSTREVQASAAAQEDHSNGA